MKDFTDAQLDELYARALDSAADAQAAEIDVEQVLLTLKRRILEDSPVPVTEEDHPAPGQISTSAPAVGSFGVIGRGAQQHH